MNRNLLKADKEYVCICMSKRKVIDVVFFQVKILFAIGLENYETKETAGRFATAQRLEAKAELVINHMIA